MNKSVPPAILRDVVRKYICELPFGTDGTEPEVTFENIDVVLILKLVILYADKDDVKSSIVDADCVTTDISVPNVLYDTLVSTFDMLLAVSAAELPVPTKYVVNVLGGTDSVTLNCIATLLLPVTLNMLLLLVNAEKLNEPLFGL